MKDFFKKVIFVIGMIVVLSSSTLCLLSNIILFVYVIYSRIKTKDKKLNKCIWLYAIQLVAYYGDSLNEINYFNSPYSIPELIGFNCLGITATYILFKKQKGNDKNE